MAACVITIQLNDNEPRRGGATLSGVVVVKPDKEIQCKGLVVRTIWSTHGRGNVDTAEVASQSLFQGTWQSGQEYRYPFTLATAVWPPTYHGSYLNVGHYVAAQAKVSWSIDPKAQVEYRVVANDAPADLKPTAAAPKQSGFIAAAILGVIAVLFVTAFVPLLLIAMLFLGPILGLTYVYKVILPKRVTGPVTCDLASAKVRAGQNVKANLVFTPARRSTINGIEWKIRCVEECVSGSGSNRRTHTCELFQDTVPVCGPTELKPGEKQSFELDYKLPANAAPSLKFADNKLQWTVVPRIDIPRWPDWTKTLEPVVIADTSAFPGMPGLSSAKAGDDPLPGQPPVVSGQAIGVGSEAAASEKTVADEAWLRQIIVQIQQTQHEEDALAMVLAAVRDFEFPIVVTLEDEIDTPEFADEAEFTRWDDAEWWRAYCPAQNMDVALAWEDGYPSDVQAGKTWRGIASIVGYEVESKQLLMVVNPGRA